MSKYLSLAHKHLWSGKPDNMVFFIHTEHGSSNVHDLNVRAFACLPTMLLNLIVTWMNSDCSFSGHSAVLHSGKFPLIPGQHQFPHAIHQREFVIALITDYCICLGFCLSAGMWVLSRYRSNWLTFVDSLSNRTWFKVSVQNKNKIKINWIELKEETVKST